MAKKYDAIVVGIGSTGASTCFQLARRGMKVLGLEKSSIPNAEASHHGHSRLIRLAGLTRTDDIPLLRRAYENWDDLQRLCGQKILHRTGGIYLGAPDSRLIVDARRSIVEYGVDCEELSQQQVVDRFPMFRPAEHWVGLIEPDAGLLVPELAVSAFADRALRYGAELRGHSPVMDWEVNGQGVCVKTDRKKYEADKLVFCGGAWSGQLLGDLGLNIRVSRQVLAWLWPRRPELFAYGRFPVWVLQPDGPPGTWGRKRQPVRIACVDGSSGVDRR